MSCSQHVIQSGNPANGPAENQDYALVRKSLLKEDSSTMLARATPLANGLMAYSVFTLKRNHFIEVRVYLWDPSDNDSEYEQIWNFRIYPSNAIVGIDEGHTANEALEYYGDMIAHLKNCW